MTNIVVTYIEKEFGLLKTEVHDIEPGALAWVKNFLKGITPVIRQAATDAVMAAFSVPGPGSVKFAAALAAATADLISKGVPVIETDLKAAIQIAYDAVPKGAIGDAVVAAADKEVDKVGDAVTSS